MTDLGIAVKPLDALYDRELTLEDLDQMAKPKGSSTPPIKRLRTQHHHLARLLAEGRREVECSAMTGYSQSRISILKNDPAFAELIEHYKTEAAAAYVNVHERLAALGVTCLEELQARVDEDPEKFSNKELRELAAMLLDRSVAPPKGVQGGQGQASGPATINIQFVQPQATQGPAVIVEQKAIEDGR